MKLRTVWVFACLFAFGCKHQNLEESFFDKPPENRLQRLRQYSLEDQYKIFRYGNDKIEPPLMELAEPIAEKGATAIPYLVIQLNLKTDDVTIRDILLILETMARSGSYDVKSNSTLMATIGSKVGEMKNDQWRTIGVEMLQHIRDSR